VKISYNNLRTRLNNFQKDGNFMAVRLSIRDYAIDPSTIPSEIDDIFQSFTQRRKDELARHYGSAYDFLVILYHLRFVQKLEYRVIASRLGMQIDDLYTHFYNLGWYFSSDFSENKMIYERTLTLWREALARAMRDAPGLDPEKHSRLKVALERSQKVYKKSYEDFNFSSAEEYARVLYYLLYIEKLSPVSISHLFNLAYRTACNKIKKLGLSVSREEVEPRKKLRRSQGAKSKPSDSQNRRLTAQLRKHSAVASQNVEYVRSQILELISGSIDSDKYEIVVGQSIIGLLGSLEIDIPVIVHDIEYDRYHRIDVEYNSNFFHTIEPNTEIENVVHNNVLKLKSIFEDPSESTMNKQEILDSLSHELCQGINSKLEGQISARQR
jgi:hypothetical protein